MQECPRAFVAVLLPDEVRGALVRFAAPLHKIGTDVRWVNEENLHITLKFLGETQAAVLESAKDEIAAAACAVQPFRLQFGGLGVFPNLSRARVVWVGVTEGAALLTGLSREVERRLVKLGFRDEDRFKAHVTVGRLRVPGADVLEEAVRREAQPLAACDVTTIHLMRSVLSPAGARYSSIASFPLGG